jgi:hypothetical protein
MPDILTLPDDVLGLILDRVWSRAIHPTLATVCRRFHRCVLSGEFLDAICRKERYLKVRCRAIVMSIRKNGRVRCYPCIPRDPTYHGSTSASTPSASFLLYLTCTHPRVWEADTREWVGRDYLWRQIMSRPSILPGALGSAAFSLDAPPPPSVSDEELVGALLSVVTGGRGFDRTLLINCVSVAVWRPDTRGRLYAYVVSNLERLDLSVAQAASDVLNHAIWKTHTTDEADALLEASIGHDLTVGQVFRLCAGQDPPVRRVVGVRQALTRGLLGRNSAEANAARLYLVLYHPELCDASVDELWHAISRGKRALSRLVEAVCGVYQGGGGDVSSRLGRYVEAMREYVLAWPVSTQRKARSRDAALLALSEPTFMEQYALRTRFVRALRVPDQPSDEE